MSAANDQVPISSSRVERVWSAWSRFWFTPADPTPLCLMRIVAGLLTLYVHIAYTFDLQAYFGHDGWYGVEQATRERREWPQFVTQSIWGPPDPRFRMPLYPDRRLAVGQFVENIAKAPRDVQDRALRLLDSVPDGPGGRAETVRYLQGVDSKAPKFEERDQFLARMVQAKKDDELAKVELPEYLLALPPPEREAFRANAHALVEVMPAERRPRSDMYLLLITQSSGEWALLRGFVDEVRNKKTPAEQKFVLGYAEKWSCSPDEPEIIARGHAFYSPFYHVTGSTGVAVLHGIHLLVIVLFTLGVWTRVTSVLTWLAALAYIQRNPLILFGQDTMMNVCLFYLMLAPCGATWSVDWIIARYREGKRGLRDGRRPMSSTPQPLISANFVTRLVQVHYCMMYMSAGLSKLKGESWWSGTAVWYTLTNPEFSPLHIAPFRNLLVWLCQNENRWLWEGYMTATAIFTLFLEIGFPILVWTRMRPVMVLGAIMLHTGIALNMGLSVFSLFMFTLMLGAWMPTSAVRRVFARPPIKLPKLQVQFHRRVPRQLRAAGLVHAFDVWNQTEITDRAGTDKPGREVGEPVAEPLSVGSGSQVWTGYAAARQVARSLGMTQPFAWLLGLPGLAQLGRAFYPASPNRLGIADNGSKRRDSKTLAAG